MDQILKNEHGHVIGTIKDRGYKQEIYDEHGHNCGSFDGKRTYNEHGHCVGEGNLLATLIMK